MIGTVHIVLAMKPVEGNFSQNALKHGVAGLNINGCRVETGDVINNHSRSSEAAVSKGKYGNSVSQDTHQTEGQKFGRWPANVIHDGSDKVIAGFPVTTSGNFPAVQNTKSWKMSSQGSGLSPARAMCDTGSAARFFKKVTL